MSVEISGWLAVAGRRERGEETTNESLASDCPLGAS